MSISNTKDNEFITAIRSGGRERMQALKNIYVQELDRNRMIGYLKARGCRNEDAEDLIQDAIIIFDKKVIEGDFMGLSSISNYIFSVVKMNWLNKHRAYQKQEDVSEMENQLLEEDVSTFYERRERTDTYHKVLNLLGERCRKLILMSTNGYDNATIAKTLDLVDRVRVQKEKYRCLSRLRNKINKSASLSEYVRNQLTSEHQ